MSIHIKRLLTCLIAISCSCSNIRADDTQASLENGVLFVQATDADEHVFVNVHAPNGFGAASVYSTGEDADTVNGQPLQADFGGTIESIHVQLGGGTDKFQLFSTIDLPGGVIIDGTEGAQRKTIEINGSEEIIYGDVAIITGSGSDWIEISHTNAVYAGSFEINTGAGSDVTQFRGGLFATTAEVDMGDDQDRIEFIAIEDYFLDFPNGLILRGGDGSDRYDFWGTHITGPVEFDGIVETSYNSEEHITLTSCVFESDFSITSSARAINFSVSEAGDWGWVTADPTEIEGTVLIDSLFGKVKADIHSLVTSELIILAESQSVNYDDDTVSITESEIDEIDISLGKGNDNVELNEVESDLTFIVLGDNIDVLTLNSNTIELADFVGGAGNDEITTDGDNDFDELQLDGFETTDVDEELSGGFSANSTVGTSTLNTTELFVISGRTTWQANSGSRGASPLFYSRLNAGQPTSGFGKLQPTPQPERSGPVQRSVIGVNRLSAQR